MLCSAVLRSPASNWSNLWSTCTIWHHVNPNKTAQNICQISRYCGEISNGWIFLHTLFHVGQRFSSQSSELLRPLHAQTPLHTNASAVGCLFPNAVPSNCRSVYPSLNGQWVCGAVGHPQSRTGELYSPSDIHVCPIDPTGTSLTAQRSRDPGAHAAARRGSDAGLSVKEKGLGKEGKLQNEQDNTHSCQPSQCLGLSLSLPPFLFQSLRRPLEPGCRYFLWWMAFLTCFKWFFYIYLNFTTLLTLSFIMQKIPLKNSGKNWIWS